MFKQIITATTPNGLILEKRRFEGFSRSSKEYNEFADKAYRELKQQHGDCYIFTETAGG